VNAGETDCVVMVADSKRDHREHGSVIIRAKEALESIPEETRRALPDGNSSVYETTARSCTHVS